MLRQWPCPPHESRRDKASQQQHWCLPEGIEEVGKEQIRKGSHGVFPFVLLNCSVNFARRLASIWRLFSRLMTNSSLDPPNMRSITSRSVWPTAFSSVTLAEYT